MKLRSLIALALWLVSAPVSAQVNPGTSPISVPKGGTGNTSLTAGRPLIGNGAAPLGVGAKTGNTTIFATGSGSYTPTNCIKSDANGNLVDAAAPCGVGTNVSYAQDFIAGTNFTAGTTTSLTLSNAPLSSQSTAVYFDGVRQSANTWSLAGSVVTFVAAIPLNTQVVEISNLTTTVLPTWVTAIGGLQNNVLLGPGFYTTGGTTLNQNIGSVDNLLPNVQWQLWSGVSFMTKQNAAGTGNQTNISCSGFGTATQSPIFACANTQQVKVGDLVVNTSNGSFWGFTGAGYITCAQVQCTQANTTAMRVTAVVPNTSISVASPGFGGVSPAVSAPAVLQVIAPGENGTGGTYGPDGWTEPGTMVATVDDWGASATPASTVYPGCIRPLLLRKGITGQEKFQWSPPANQLARYLGQTISFGAVVYQRVQGGAGTWNLHIDDSTGATASANGTGAAFGGYQFLSVTRTIAQTATSLTIYINTTGNSGDVFDICLPTAAFVPSLVQSQLHQNSHELIRANSHWNPPLLTPLFITFPSTPLFGLFGWNNLDLEALSFGTMHNSVGNVYAKIEWTTSTVGAGIFTGPNVNTCCGLTFGPQTGTIVAGQPNIAGGRWPLYHDGTGSIFSGVSGLVPTSGTFDFWDVEINPDNSID